MTISEDRIERNHYADHPVAAIRFAFEKLDDQEDRIFFLENWMYGHWEILDTEYGDDWVPFVLANPDHKAALTSDAANMRADIDSAWAEEREAIESLMGRLKAASPNYKTMFVFVDELRIVLEYVGRARTPVAAETDKGWRTIDDGSLSKYGWAAGTYSIVCLACGQHVDGADRLATSCQQCASKAAIWKSAASPSTDQQGSG